MREKGKRSRKNGGRMIGWGGKTCNMKGRNGRNGEKKEEKKEEKEK